MFCPVAVTITGVTTTKSLDCLSARALARFPADVRADAALSRRLRKLAAVSEFAVDTLLQQPELLAALAADDGAAPLPVPELGSETGMVWAQQLRRYRQAESTRLVWRDALGLDDIGQTLAASTRLADTCLALALGALEREFIRRYGVVRDAHGQPVRLVVFALGKLGGAALNFSSDVDLVYAWAADGVSDGPRVLAAGEYFMRLGQQLTRLLDETTADGVCYRVDLRLRPFGSAAPLAHSFAALEMYFQREGRDWERYAWLKARPVAGDLAAGERFLDTLRPFVYRRYLDYGALDGLREMKATIAAEVARKELTDDIKRGPGGIREIEFLVQVLQLIRGGREASLRERRLVPALDALAAKLPALDILVCNAGIVSNTPAQDMGDEEWQRVIDINLTGVFKTCRAFGRAMIAARRGSIINIGSISGQIVNRPQPQCHYNASKAGVHHLTRSLAVEWAQYGVRVNAVAPTYIATPLIEQLRGQSGLVRQWLDDTPMRRLGTPEEIASVVLFLASDAASLVTGSIINADGGFTSI